MTALPQRKYISPEEYLAAERESLERHEYFDGEIFLMAGSSRKHSLISSNINTSLSNQLKKRDCEVHSSDLRVHIPKTGLFTYPDVLVVCGKPELLPDAHLDTLTNPILIVEVLSASTENYDKSIKFDNYRSLDSLREYVLISQDAKKVMRYTKQTDGSWNLMDFIGETTEIALDSIECSLLMDDIYDKVDFEASAG